MKIIYFGSDVFLSTFQYLLREHEIMALYTYHHEEDYFNEWNIVDIARAHGIPVHYVQITEEKMLSYLDRGCGLFFVAEYSHKIPVPEDPRFRAVNFHSSLLPEGRSYYPIECAMERGKQVGGVTLHKAVRQLDRGDILAQSQYDIRPEDDSVDLYIKGSKVALEITRRVMDSFEECWERATPQPRDTDFPYWKSPPVEKMTLHHGMTREEARGVYRRYNKMTLVLIEERYYRVDGFATGTVRLKEDEENGVLFLRDDRVLYDVADGHLRLDIAAVGEEEVTCQS